MDIKGQIRELATAYAQRLGARMDARAEEMRSDDKSHYLIYRVLGITDEEGERIDLYENKGRFLYKYAGAFLEEAALLCFKARFPDAQKARIENTLGRRPRQFGIDCLIGQDALEIKWRDATTDGDHITKEHTRIQAIKERGLGPVRIMFYYPNRGQALRIQETIKTVYHGVGGECYMGDAAWDYLYMRTGIDLKRILLEITAENRNLR